MNSESILAFVAAGFSTILAIAGFFQHRRSIATWCFIAGMLGLAIEATITGLAFSQTNPTNWAAWHELGLIVKAFLPGIWLAFSVTYSRGEKRESMKHWRWILLATVLVPIGILALFPDQIIQEVRKLPSGQLWLSFATGAKLLNFVALIGVVLILTNLERTFRASVGTMQWRIKFLILGLAVIFGARIYTRTQGLVSSGHNYAMPDVETVGLMIGCVLIGLGYLRSGLSEIDVYPSRAVLHTSLTIVLVGGYLFFVGVLAQFAARGGGAGSFQLQAFVVLLAIAVLGVLLLSERLRQRVKAFVTHHFKRPQYDFQSIWTRFTRSTSSATSPTSVCAAAAELISDTFNVLSVSAWLLDEDKEHLTLCTSTARALNKSGEESIPFSRIEGGVNASRDAFDLDKLKGDWAETLRAATGSQFSSGGRRLCVPLWASDQFMGLIVLADRVRGIPYTTEESALLKCLGDQTASSLLNLRLAQEIVFNKELEAFQTISAFFVHDLKNAASTLRLMLQNLPVHFADPNFRADALRGIANTTNRINQIIDHLGTVRSKLELHPSEVDLNALVNEAIESVNGYPGIEIDKQLRPIRKLIGDPDRLRSVVMNLLLNARDAVGPHGRIRVETGERDGWARLSVTDDGCGMTTDFVRESLYRPFKTTKKKGLGIGMFQTKMIIEAHQGNIRVKSDIGKGTTFHVLLPLGSREQ